MLQIMKGAVRGAMTMLAATALFSAASAQNALTDLFGAGFPGAKIVQEGGRDYDEKEFFVGPFQSLYEPGDVLRLEGRVFEAVHEVPSGRSTLEVFRAYERNLTAEGFGTLFTCVDETGDDGCGGNIGNALLKRSLTNFQYRDDQRFGVYERVAGGAREVVSVYVTIRPSGDPSRRDVAVVLEALTTEAEEDDLVRLDASAIAQAIAADGAAAIYGLEFATGSAELLPASKAVVTEMAGYLKANPDVAILLVGHTDNQGGLELNMDLSKRRADAVRSALIADHGIAGGRLAAHGVGYLAPKAANADEAGRAKNRRVEMVLR